jgi:hypothetical protein
MLKVIFYQFSHSCYLTLLKHKVQVDLGDMSQVVGVVMFQEDLGDTSQVVGVVMFQEDLGDMSQVVGVVMFLVDLVDYLA